MKNLSKFVASVLTAALSFAAVAGEHAKQKHTQSNSMSAYIDPETGELTNTPSQEALDSLSPKAKTVDISESGVAEVIDMGNGMKKVQFNREFHKTLEATIDENGELQLGHGLDHEELGE